MELTKSVILKLFGIILIFFFLPLENRIFLFHNTADAYYGEFDINCRQKNYALAKNSANMTICLDKKTVNEIYCKDFRNSHTIFSKRDNSEIPQFSYALIFRSHPKWADVNHSIKINDCFASNRIGIFKSFLKQYNIV